ncbi:MAG: AroM family protein [Chloroflexota bacterium]
MNRTLGALVIGQSPRPDLTQPLRDLLPADVVLREVGALDGLTLADLPDASGAAYPLGTRMRDGTAVTIPESFLLPLLQQQLDALEADDVAATVLLCAGSFAELRGKRPLFKPFDIAQATLTSLGLRRIATLTPFAGQITPIQQRWHAAGFAAHVWARPLADTADFANWLRGQLAQTEGVDCLLLDYVGHDPQARMWLQTACTELAEVAVSLPILDLGHLTLSTAAAALR